MVRAARPDQVLFIHRRRPRHAAAATFNVVIMREELLQQFGGGEPEDQDPRIRHGHRRRGYDRRPWIVMSGLLQEYFSGGREEGRQILRSSVTNNAIIGKATERISSAEWHALIFAKLGLLLNLIQIMYQNRSDSPFQTHPATMAISVAAICISGFAAAALLNSKAVKVEEEDKEEQQTTGKYFLYCRRIIDMLVLISGVVTLSCLVSVFVPDGLGWIVFVSCASTIFALLVGWRFLFLPIFGRTKSGHGELGPSRV